VLGVSLPAGQAQRLVELYDYLRPFPDAAPAPGALAERGYELAVLSNGTPAMIGNCLANSGLGDFFGRRVSVDEVRVFKPSPVVYRHAAGRLEHPARDQQCVRQRRRERGRPAHGLGEPLRRPVRHDRRPA
jgi:2-haloacid dehalogenase